MEIIGELTQLTDVKFGIERCTKSQIHAIRPPFVRDYARPFFLFHKQPISSGDSNCEGRPSIYINAISRIAWR